MARIVPSGCVAWRRPASARPRPAAPLNRLLPRYDDVVVCTYDLTRFPASIILDVLRTHPMAVLGGILQENPFFVGPDEFLRELHERERDRDVTSLRD